MCYVMQHGVNDSKINRVYEATNYSITWITLAVQEGFNNHNRPKMPVDRYKIVLAM